MKVQVVCKSKHLKDKDCLYYSIVPHHFCIKWFISPPTTFYIVTSLIVWHILHLIGCQICVDISAYTHWSYHLCQNCNLVSMIQASKANRNKRFYLFQTLRPALGPHSVHIQCVLGDLSEEVKQLGQKAHHSPPSSAVVKKEWSYTSSSPVRLIVVQGQIDIFLYL